jgi:hypothetical protein
MDQLHQFFQFPNMIGQSRLHGWRDTECLVNPAVVVVHEMQRDIMGVI